MRKPQIREAAEIDLPVILAVYRSAGLDFAVDRKSLA